MQGTRAYISASQLSNPRRHRVYHDMESFFYVLFLAFFLYEGPSTDGVVHSRSWPRELRIWQEGSGEQIRRSKHALFFEDQTNYAPWRDLMSETSTKWTRETLDLYMELLGRLVPHFSCYHETETATHGIMLGCLEGWLRHDCVDSSDLGVSREFMDQVLSSDDWSFLSV